MPGLWRDEALKTLAAAKTVAAGFLTLAVAGDHRYVEPHHRADVAIGLAVGAKNFDHLPGGADAGSHLTHPGVLAARIGVNRLQQFHLGLEGRRFERIVLSIELAVCAAGRICVFAAM